MRYFIGPPEDEPDMRRQPWLDEHEGQKFEITWRAGKLSNPRVSSIQRSVQLEAGIWRGARFEAQCLLEHAQWIRVLRFRASNSSCRIWKRFCTRPRDLPNSRSSTTTSGLRPRFC